MRTHLLAAAFACVVARGAGAATAGELTVEITHVRGASGEVEVVLWAKSDGFPDCTDRPVAERIRLKAAPGVVAFRLGEVAPGVYGISLYHDERNLGEGYYNRQRIHSSIGYLTPEQAERTAN